MLRKPSLSEGCLRRKSFHNNDEKICFPWSTHCWACIWCCFAFKTILFNNACLVIVTWVSFCNSSRRRSWGKQPKKFSKPMIDPECLIINPIPTRLFLCSKNQGGGGGHIVLPPPPSKNPVTLFRIHSNKVFLKACPKMNLVTQL